MSREDSTILKGIAILMMLFLHLFNHLGDTTPLYNIIYINDIPLVHWLTRACNPVHLQLPIICLTLLFPFLIGAIARKHCVFEIISENITYSKAHYPWIFTILLLALVLFRCLWAGQYFNFAYASIFIILFLQIPLHRYIRAMLLHLGRYSMDMWMIHTWICYYLFHEFIYGLHYPLLMFAVLTILSYVAAKTINMFINTIKVWSSGLHTE